MNSESSPTNAGHRSGFIALAGRPNVGKSTLVNALVGSKVAIMSNKPQTTRRVIRGIVTKHGEWQMVLSDLPGVQRPRDTLTQRMQRSVEQELKESDGTLFVVNAQEGVGPGDRFIAEALVRAKTAVVIAVNKLDLVKKAQTVETLQAVSDLGLGAEIFPISAKTGSGLERLVSELVSLLPEGPPYFPEGETSDLSEHVALAELVREQVLHRTRQEVPHAVEVQIDEIEERERISYVRAILWVDTESQKSIVIGAGGRMIKEIGISARKEIQQRLGRKVHLDLSVRTRKGWRTDPALLDRLGIT